MAPDRAGLFRLVLQSATEQLRTCLADAPAGSGGTPYLDALVLLRHAAGLTTEQLFAAFDDPVPPDTRAQFEALLRRRCAGEPVSYIRGFKEFYGREFAVGPGVLVPRPDTETLVECAIEALKQTPGEAPFVHDCCTGTGCVAITVACEAGCAVTASDISEDAIAYARRNAAANGQANLEIWQGDLLSPLRERIERGETPSPNIITANPPYVVDNEVVDLTSRGWPEPSVALSGGIDGLDFVRRLVREAPACLADGGWLMVEIGSDQGPVSFELMNCAGFQDVALVRDLSGHVRVCKARWYRT